MAATGRSATMQAREAGEQPAVLSQRALNRALLARQHLLARATIPTATMVEHLVGMQAQMPGTPYTALWSRLTDFRPEELSDLIAGRQAVRIVLMRSTVHLVTARDCMALRPVLGATLARFMQVNTAYGRQLAGLDLAEVVAAGRALVEGHPLTLVELGVALQARWPERDAASLAQAIRALAPLVQVPPRGLWGGVGQARCTTAESWLGRPLDTDTAPDATILRYLAAFGPASARDAQIWSGLGPKDLGVAFERLRPQLLTFRDGRGRELFDLPDAPRPDPETAAPARFLPEFDNLTLSHADRARIIADDHRRQIATANGVVPGTILVDGFVGGRWKVERRRDGATLTIDPFAPLSAGERDAFGEEGERLLALLAGDTPDRAVRFAALP